MAEHEESLAGAMKSRRRLLATLAAAGIPAVAGCNSSGSSDPTTADPTESPTTNPPTTTTNDGGIVSQVLGTTRSGVVAPAAGTADVSWLDGADLSVQKVTTLDSSGPGSLRAALNGVGPRLVVFEVGGVIDLDSYHLSIGTGQVYIAGQTAPSPGITLIRGGLHIDASNVVVQHLRVRPGDDIPGPTDSITNSGGANVVVDHCSASWGTDETLSTNAGVGNPGITYTNNIVAEGLHDSIHPKGPHSMGSLIMNRSKKVALMGNLWAHNNGRNPRLKGGTSTIVANNVGYNFGRGLHLGGGVESATTSTILGNYYRAGPDTDTGDPVVGTTFTDASGPVRAYVAFNETDPSDLSFLPSATQIERVSDRPFWPSGLETSSPAAAYETVLAGAGARPADRTPHDERIITDVMERTGDIIDSQSAVGGYPDLQATERSLDVPDEDIGSWLAGHTAAVVSGD